MVLLLEDPLFNRDKGITTIWLLATLGSRSTYSKISKKDIERLDIPQTCTTLKSPTLNFSLRQSSSLLYGITLVYKQKADYSLRDANTAKLFLKRQLSNKSSGFVNQTNSDMYAELESCKPNLTNMLLRDDPNFHIDVRATDPFGLNLNDIASKHGIKGIREDLDYNNLGWESSISDPDVQIALLENEDHFESRQDFILDEEFNNLGDQEMDFVFGDDGEAVMIDDGYDTNKDNIRGIRQDTIATDIARDDAQKFPEAANNHTVTETEAVLDEYDFGNTRHAEFPPIPMEEVPAPFSGGKQVADSRREPCAAFKRRAMVIDNEIRLRIGDLKAARDRYIDLRNDERIKQAAKTSGFGGSSETHDWFRDYQSTLSTIQRLTFAKSFVKDLKMGSKILGFMQGGNKNLLLSGESLISRHRRSSSVTSIEEARRAEIVSSRRNSVAHYEDNFDVFMDQYDNALHDVNDPNGLDDYEFTGNDAILDITWNRTGNVSGEFILPTSQFGNEDELEDGRGGELQRVLALDKNVLSSRPGTVNSDQPTRIKRRRLNKNHENDDSVDVEVEMDIARLGDGDRYMAEPPSTGVSYFAFDNARLKYIDRSARNFFGYIQSISMQAGDSLDYELEEESGTGMDILLKEITFEQIAPCQSESPVKRRFAAEAMQKLLLLATRSMVQLEIKPDFGSSKWETQKSHNIAVILNAAEL